MADLFDFFTYDPKRVLGEIPSWKTGNPPWRSPKPSRDRARRAWSSDATRVSITVGATSTVTIVCAKSAPKSSNGWPASCGDEARELSILDCIARRYLDRVPPELSLRAIGNDEPEDLFVFGEDGERRMLHTTSDRPEVVAHAFGGSHVFVHDGDAGSIVDVSGGIPHALLTHWEGDISELEVLRWSELEDEDDELKSSPAAIGFDRTERVWNVLWTEAVLTDHRTRRPVRLAPAPHYAAFEPSGRRLLVARHDRFTWIDVDRRAVESVGTLP